MISIDHDCRGVNVELVAVNSEAIQKRKAQKSYYLFLDIKNSYSKYEENVPNRFTSPNFWALIVEMVISSTELLSFTKWAFGGTTSEPS